MDPTTPAASPGRPVSWFGADAVLVPVKRFSEAKLRLAPALSPERRAELARTMAERVIASAGGLPVAVVCDDRGVAGWARAQGALVIWEPGRGLNGAVEEGVGRLAAAGVELVVVAAGDLPLASDLRWVTEHWSPEGVGVTIVPDRRHDGTNVIAVPTHPHFGFSYGPGSYARHLGEAHRLGLPVRVVHDSPLAWDVDLPADLVALQR